MKKSIKILLSFALIAVMSLCLCGCQELNDMRAQHGVWTNNDNFDSITIQDTEYIKLKGKNLYNLIYLDSDISEINITNKDVPVLLSAEFNDGEFYITKDKKFIYGSIYNEVERDSYGLFGSLGSYVSATYEDGFYARKDIYDVIKDKLDNEINYTKYGYQYWYFDEENLADITDFYYLSDTEINAVNEITCTVESKQIEELPYELSYISQLDSVSDDKWFHEYRYEIYKSEDQKTYYLTELDSEDTFTYQVWEVPQEYNSTFDKLTECAMLETYYFSIDENLISAKDVYV